MQNLQFGRDRVVGLQVGFIEWTVNSKLRHPRLLGVRDDKAAREVVWEQEQESSADYTNRL